MLYLNKVVGWAKWNKSFIMALSTNIHRTVKRTKTRLAASLIPLLMTQQMMLQVIEVM